MEENHSKDVFQPLQTSTPVKRPLVCVDLLDTDSDASSLETPTKRRPLNESCWVNLDDTSSTSCAQSSLCNADSPAKSDFEEKIDAGRGPVCVNINDSTSDNPLEDTLESNQNLGNPSTLPGTSIRKTLGPLSKRNLLVVNVVNQSKYGQTLQLRFLNSCV